MLSQQLLGQDGVLSSGTEGPREAVVVLEGTPRHPWLEALLGPRGVDLLVELCRRRIFVERCCRVFWERFKTLQGQQRETM